MSRVCHTDQALLSESRTIVITSASDAGDNIDALASTIEDTSVKRSRGETIVVKFGRTIRSLLRTNNERRGTKGTRGLEGRNYLSLKNLNTCTLRYDNSISAIGARRETAKQR